MPNWAASLPIIFHWPLASDSVKLNGLNLTFLRPWFHFSDTAPGLSADLNPALCRPRPWTNGSGPMPPLCFITHPAISSHYAACSHFLLTAALGMTHRCQQ
ncbi:hypothetical protein GGI42DRAFT_103252 [Trichoderma sp. SZMC 28013]